jgi:hypothetical protein
MMNHDDLVASREYIFETNEPRSRDVVTVERVGWEAGIVIVVWRGGQHACVPVDEFLLSAEPLMPYKGGSTFEFDPLLRKEVPPRKTWGGDLSERVARALFPAASRD